MLNEAHHYCDTTCLQMHCNHSNMYTHSKQCGQILDVAIWIPFLQSAIKCMRDAGVFDILIKVFPGWQSTLFTWNIVSWDQIDHFLDYHLIHYLTNSTSLAHCK